MQQTRVETLVREYKSSKDYQKDAAKLGKDGWAPSQTIEARGGPRWGISLVLLIFLIVPGILALLFLRKTKLVVTYTRSVPV